MLAVLLSAPALGGVDPAVRSLPLDVGDAWRPLVERREPELQAKLVAELARVPRWDALVRREKMAVGLVDMSAQAPRLAMINGRRTMYAASLPKIGVLYAAFKSLDDGLLQETPDLRRDLQSMIRHSSNDAATRLIREIGFERIASELAKPAVQLYDKERGGGLWVGRAYASRGARHPDLVQQVTHGASAFQVCRFYYLLAHGRLIDRERSSHMLELLSSTTMRHKFAHYLGQTADLANVYRKSGTWRDWHSDSVLVWEGGSRKYILVALVEDSDGEKILRELPPVIERLLADGAPE